MSDYNKLFNAANNAGKTPEQLYIEKLRRVIPPEMQAEKRWTQCFQTKKATAGMSGKVPCSNHSDPNTWLTFEEVCHSSFKMVDGVWVREEDGLLRPGRGIGFHFLNSEYLPIDIDHVRNKATGQWCSEAKIFVSKMQTYTEWSVSGTGLHCIGLGNIRHRELKTQHIQFWNGRLGVPRYFWLTGDVLGDDFTKLRNCAEDFQMYASHPRMFSVKMQEELVKIDPEQAAKLPPECDAPVEETTREKTKTKTRRVVKDFDIEDYLKFNNLKVSSRAVKDIGTCYYLTTCPFKGSEHAGQNATTTNFIYPTADGGLAFHCQSTHDEGNTIAEVIKILAERNGPYPKPIYVEEKKQQPTSLRSSRLQCVTDITEEPETWLWPGYLPTNQLVHFAGKSSEGKSPVTLDLCRPVTTGSVWPDGTPNTNGPRSVILMAGEDDWKTIIKPRLRLAGVDMSKVHRFISTLDRGDGKVVDVSTNLEHDIMELRRQIESLSDVGLVVIDPITNYLGSKKMNMEEEMRQLLMPLSEQVAQAMKVCVVTVGHLNKRGSEAAVLERLMGASAFGGVARQVFIFGPDPDETGKKYHHIMGEERNKSVPTLKYKTEKVSVDWEGWGDEKVLRLVWCGVSTATNEESVNPDKEQTKADIELAWPALKATLVPGTRLQAQQCKEAVLGGVFKERPDCFWQRARKKAGVGTKQEDRKWWWFSEATPSLTEQFDTKERAV